MLENFYVKEFKFKFPFKILLYYLLGGLLAVGILSFLENKILSGAEILGVMGFVFSITFLGIGLGYALSYKRITLLYQEPNLQIVLDNGYKGPKNKTLLINLDEVVEYKERHTYKGCGYLQFVMKNGSIIELAYSPHVNMYVRLRQEIFHILDNKNIKKTCCLKP